MNQSDKSTYIRSLFLFLALCCALCGWNFVLRVAIAGAAHQGREIRANKELIPYPAVEL